MPSVAALVRDDGSAFELDVVADLTRDIESLSTADRIEFRNANSAAVAGHNSQWMLIAAGPGTGKSHLFLDRIRSWLTRFPDRTVRVSSFVRKLVIDLENDIRSSDLTPEQKASVIVSTLHGLARSIVERNGGTRTQPMGSHIRMISAEWKPVVWADLVRVQEPPRDATSRQFEAQYQDLQLIQGDGWEELRSAYVTLCRFYNALGFADSILLAVEALTENPSLRGHALWIFDEFQDFNAAEEQLVRACTEGAAGVLLAGDDDQALYQHLKGSHPEIIRRYYRDSSVVNAMLPLCGRSRFHICMGATAFLNSHRSEHRIEKIYLPIDTAGDSNRIQVVAASTPRTSVKYATEFIEQHRSEIESRRTDILNGNSKDPYLLILSLQGDVTAYLGNEGHHLMAVVEQWRLEEVGPGEDYTRVRIYYRHHVAPLENFTLRKVLHLEGLDPDTAVEVIADAMSAGTSLTEVDHPAIASARARCAEIAAILDDEERDAETKAAAVAECIRVGDVDRLSADLGEFPVNQGLSRSEEEEEIETVGLASPVELMTMMRAKGLSADHVILIGADSVNLGHASPELFFVAMTRARDSLHLLMPLGARGASNAHPYVLDLPDDHCTYLTYKADGPSNLRNRQALIDYLSRRQIAIQRSRST